MRKINFKTNFILFAGCILFLISCNQVAEDELTGYEDFFLVCSKSAWVDTRAVTDEAGSGEFAEGDEIDVQITAGNTFVNTQLEYANGSWTPALHRGEYGQNELVVSALHPVLSHIDGNKTERSFSLPNDQSNMERYTNADVLFADAKADASSPSVALQFHHVLHRICIRLKGNVPEDLQIGVRSRTSAKISIIDGSVTLEDNNTYSWIKPLKQDNSTYTVLVLPQDAASYSSGEGLLQLKSNGKVVSYPLDAKISSFKSGMQTTLNLTLKDAETGNVDIEFANQTRWVYGVHSPNFPGRENIPSKPSWEKEFQDGLWFRYSYDNMYPPLPYENQYLTWKEGCGWFDCNKSFKYQGDGNLCWAAMASNLLHWWMVQNQKYIAAYDAKYTNLCNGVKRPEKYTRMTSENQNHSEVFNFFKNNFPDRGNWDTGGVNWFINGSQLASSVWPNFPGFFREVFSATDAIAEEVRGITKEKFNLWMKDAFRNNKAIGFTAYDFAGVGTGRHSMTIWGAEFDAEGNVAFVYFCDNNRGEDEPNHASLRRYKIEYAQDSASDQKLYAYLMQLDYNDGTKPKAKSLFTSITLVDLRLDIWEKAQLDVNKYS